MKIRKIIFAFLPIILFACDSVDEIDLKCGELAVLGTVSEEVADVSIGGTPRVLPLQGVFTDEPAAKYAPQYLSDPKFAMTVKNYVGLMPNESKVDFMAYMRNGKAEYYELEIENKKWQCH